MRNVKILFFFNTYLRSAYVVCRPSSVVRRQPSAVRRPSSAVRRPPSAVRRLHPTLNVTQFTQKKISQNK
ncbi:MAG TPA: hypothetical protein ENJ53_00435 [Phaeodactylibacter sp.]|nr:hypothetical protein [Phaeodactylibacter sp.]